MIVPAELREESTQALPNEVSFSSQTLPRSSFVLEDVIVRTENRPVGLASVHPAVADARAVMFDFDFTLANSSSGVVICVNHALSRLGLPESPADAITRTIGLDTRWTGTGCETPSR